VNLAEAQRAGFRACKQCKPEGLPTSNNSIVNNMRILLEENRERSVPLEELGRHVGLSVFSAQKKFKAAMGLSPLEYQNALRATALRASLRKGKTVTDSIYDAGYNASSQVYQGTNLGMTPARFAAGGRGEVIHHCEEKSEHGWLIVGSTARGLCWLALAGTKHEAIDGLKLEFPAAVLKSDESLGKYIRAAIATVESGKESELPLDLRGTAFQLRVWNALRTIQRGKTLSYGELARKMGIPRSTRAVARACATNRVALLVPCHRIVGADGSLTGYRWGVERKRQLLEAEGA
jgi:AraC family transcriptional regulator of adaptative response/methylated-DNA-[protein]-cysteine methyltransferase